MEKYYVVHFDGEYHDTRTDKTVKINGYYANSQRNYEWSFTEDINRANLYRSIKYAHQKMIHSSHTSSYRNLVVRIIEVELKISIGRTLSLDEIIKEEQSRNPLLNWEKRSEKSKNLSKKQEKMKAIYDEFE